MRHIHLLAVSALMCFATASVAIADLRLIMVEQDGCVYCRMWDETIAPIYPKTPEGKFAPLERADIAETKPAGVNLKRRVNFTPTFILANDQNELARIEGYPGEDFFWGLLKKMLETHAEFEGSSS